ncbi:MAG: hypothetical protein WCS55_09565 [Sulfuricurvum sp.]|uniref:hypothetical protein n=1 Tax=Sulfuricurvum sp. TaxID=2025608 RepID=UPI00260AC00A|nr:hypothetical protein [uncultured Sulfuricurvum sp.]MDD2839314.1 hypothetical protein [Sulfuricurvum sp.]
MIYSAVEGFHETFSDWLINRTTEQAVMTYRAKMTMFEMAKCLEMSILKSLPLEDVLIKMAEFKQTSAHRLYKREFSL